MKNITTIALLIFISSYCYSQTQYSYTYDGAGNRITRTVVSKKTTEPAEQKVADFGVKVFPNPTVDFIKVNFDGISKDNKIKVELFDLSGNRIYFSQENLSQLSIDLTNYFC